jgi:hypothetical protein
MKEDLILNNFRRALTARKADCMNSGVNLLTPDKYILNAGIFAGLDVALTELERVIEEANKNLDED